MTEPRTPAPDQGAAPPPDELGTKAAAKAAPLANRNCRRPSTNFWDISLIRISSTAQSFPHGTLPQRSLFT